MADTYRKIERKIGPHGKLDEYNRGCEGGEVKAFWPIGDYDLGELENEHNVEIWITKNNFNVPLSSLIIYICQTCGRTVKKEETFIKEK